jgi:hypothetical protein
VSQYRQWIAGIAVYFIVFAAIFVTTRSVLPALLLGAVLGGSAGLLTYSLAPSEPELVQYQLASRRRVRTVLKTSDQIADCARQVKDQASREALLKACDVIRDLLSLAQAKDPDNIASTAAKVGVYITSVNSAVDAQLQIEAHPEYWPNADELLTANQAGFMHFRDFAISSVQQLNQGEVTTLRANLNVLTPMSIPALSA